MILVFLGEEMLHKKKKTAMQISPRMQPIKRNFLPANQNYIKHHFLCIFADVCCGKLKEFPVLPVLLQMV